MSEQNGNAPQKEVVHVSRIREEKEPPLKPGRTKNKPGDFNRKLKRGRSPRSPK